MEEENIITLEGDYNPMLAQIISGRLHANGIPCFIAGENTPYNEVLGVKIKIFERDKERCLKILAEDVDNG
jgi:hypothetical protein